MIFPRILTASVLAFSLAVPAVAQEAGDVVATVNGKDITLGQMIIAREGLPEQYQQIPDDLLFKGILDQLVRQEVLAQSGDEAETPRMSMTLHHELRGMLAAREVQKIAEAAITEEAIAALYAAEYGNAGQSTEYNAAHILVKTEDEAKALIEALNDGADFAELAKEKSTGPSGPSGGALGWFGQGMMVKPFEQAVVEMEPGAISLPVETQFGWHVIKLNETRLTDAPVLEDVRGDLEVMLAERAIEEHIEALVDNAVIDRSGESKVDAALIRKSEILGE